MSWPRDEDLWSALSEVLRGGADMMEAGGCAIVGGHSIDDREPKYGFAVAGVVDEERLTTKSGARVGDRLVLTKPLGVGVIATAVKREMAPVEVVSKAVEVMTSLNSSSAEAIARVDVSAVTDVTGFGLLGHLKEMVDASSVSALIDVSSVPVISGARELLGLGCWAGGSRRNLQSVEDSLVADGVDEILVRLLADAQTSGGLLIAVPEDRASALIEAVAESGARPAVIGELVEGDGRIVLY